MSPQGTELPIPTAYMIIWLAAQAGPSQQSRHSSLSDPNRNIIGFEA